MEYTKLLLENENHQKNIECLKNRIESLENLVRAQARYITQELTNGK